MLNFEALENSIKSDILNWISDFGLKDGCTICPVKIHARLSNVLINTRSHYKHEKLDTRK
jgi:hypothetical protein